MAIQLNRGPSAGAALGSAFGTGISEALKGLAEGRQKQASLQNMLQSGISPRDAQLIGQYSPQEQVKLLSQLWQRPGAFGGQMGEGQQAEGGMPGAPSAQGGSGFYQPTREDLRKQEELALKKESVDLRKQEALRNSPFFKGIQEKVAPSKEVLNIANSIREVLPKLQAVGPIKGRLPAVSEEAALFDSLSAQLLLLKSAAERIPGVRGSDFYFKLQQLSKVDRSQPPAVIERRLADMEQAAQDLIKKGEIQDKVIEMHPNMSPSQAETLVKNVEKIYNRLPSPNDVDESGNPLYQEGDEGEDAGYRFKLMNGNWVYQGKSGR